MPNKALLEKRLAVTVHLRTRSGQKEAKAFIDIKANKDFISQMLVKELGLPTAYPLPRSAKAIDKSSLYVYKGVNAVYKLRDSLGQER